MKLPAREKAYVPSEKIFDYLPSHTHSAGKAKANFFREFDFNEANTGSLETGLLRIAQQEDVASATTTCSSLRIRAALSPSQQFKV
jgi:hypothetical protein